MKSIEIPFFFASFNPIQCSVPGAEVPWILNTVSLPWRVLESSGVAGCPIGGVTPNKNGQRLLVGWWFWHILTIYKGKKLRIKHDEIMYPSKVGDVIAMFHQQCISQSAGMATRMSISIGTWWWAMRFRSILFSNNPTWWISRTGSKHSSVNHPYWFRRNFSIYLFNPGLLSIPGLWLQHQIAHIAAVMLVQR